MASLIGLQIAMPLLVAAGSAHQLQPNPPVWPSSVHIFAPEDSAASIQAAVEAVFAKNGGQTPHDHGQFSSGRFAFLFKPGTYDVEVPVGYYTQVLGLGSNPSDVVFISAKGVYSEEGNPNITIGALNSFWRGAENFETRANFAWNGGKGMLWATAQASPLRRLLVQENLLLAQTQPMDRAAGYASGGMLANSEVKGAVHSGSQQQYLTRNSEIGGWPDGVWNMAFVGTKGAPSSHCGRNLQMCSNAYVTVDATPIVAEKPFISIHSSGRYVLNIPRVRSSSEGADWTVPEQVDFESVYVARNDTDSSTSINAKLGEGLHIVLSPGIYSLDSALLLQFEGQVLLGLGYATLVAEAGTPALQVANVDGVRVAGVMLQAGEEESEALLQWGDGSYAGNSMKPGFLHDVFARVGGPDARRQVQAKVMVRIDSGHVIGDHLWLWRADHAEGGHLVRSGENPCDVGIIVNGDDVTMYGLMVEHTLKDLTQWNGERGATYFYQSELPYDVTQADYGDKGYTGYRVASNVASHSAYAVGVYHYFRDHVVTVDSGIVAPTHLEDSFVFPLSVFLNGRGFVRNIINDKGKSTSKTDGSMAVPAWHCAAEGTAMRPRLRGNVNWTLAAVPAAGCTAGDPVTCPGTRVGCAGNSCCPDGSTCPSADRDFGCCPKPKAEDCVMPGSSPKNLTTTPEPSLSPSTSLDVEVPSTSVGLPSAQPVIQKCQEGDSVFCPGSATLCSGGQCCPDGSACPSASEDFTGCPKRKIFDCLRIT
eukprot:TRINITY_DN372_c0_g1_i1.p1 TRINITY_DN372_c0_g1~~TRINITY_DN372_c0_g1_i1.p1  ORF type:complete len:777 (+),score=117.95 TRINITY_DN372_c0_g1_i1:43-2331(+)